MKLETASCLKTRETKEHLKIQTAREIQKINEIKNHLTQRTYETQKYMKPESMCNAKST